MARLILVCGPVGVGKTTHAIAQCNELGAVRFSIDPWMQTLFSKDMTALDYSWMIERVNRCYEQIWDTAEQILKLDGNVILDLGFTTKAQREVFYHRAQQINVIPELHYLDASKNVRKQRVEKRNKEQDPLVFSFEVTDQMFNFMEPRFEVPSADELENGRSIDCS